MSAKVLVIGGAGYLGSILVPELLNRDYTVSVLDNFLYGQTSLLNYCIYDNFNIIRGDYRNDNTLKEMIKEADIIIPLAAIVGASACDADQTAAISTNLEAIKSLLKIRSHDQIIVFPCTNSGYGIGEKDNYCTEESPLHPISLYGQTKVEAEKALLDGGNAISLRLATVFGLSPRMRLDLLVNDFVYRACKDRFIIIFEGHFKRNYIHIRDVARAFIHAIENFTSMKNQPYNVGLSDANLSKLELCKSIQKHIPSFVFLEAAVGEDPDKRDYIVSNEKIEKTGFKPMFSLDCGIQELIKGFNILNQRHFSNI